MRHLPTASKLSFASAFIERRRGRRYEAERIGMGQGELHAAKENFRTLLNMVVGLASAEVYAMGTRRGKPSFFFTVTIAFALVHLAATLGWTAKERGAKYD